MTSITRPIHWIRVTRRSASSYSAPLTTSACSARTLPVPGLALSTTCVTGSNWSRYCLTVSSGFKPTSRAYARTKPRRKIPAGSISLRLVSIAWRMVTVIFVACESRLRDSPRCSRASRSAAPTSMVSGCEPPSYILPHAPDRRRLLANLRCVGREPWDVGCVPSAAVDGPAISLQRIAPVEWWKICVEVRGQRVRQMPLEFPKGACASGLVRERHVERLAVHHARDVQSPLPGRYARRSP